MLCNFSHEFLKFKKKGYIMFYLCNLSLFNISIYYYKGNEYFGYFCYCFNYFPRFSKLLKKKIQKLSYKLFCFIDYPHYDGLELIITNSAQWNCVSWITLCGAVFLCKSHMSLPFTTLLMHTLLLSINLPDLRPRSLTLIEYLHKLIRLEIS